MRAPKRTTKDSLGERRMKFSVYGPFDIPRTKGLIDTDTKIKKTFWEGVDQEISLLSGACGCYIYVVKAGPAALPWYVGLTTKRTFREECFHPFQVNHYNKGLAGKGKGKPQIFFLAKETPTGAFAKPSVNSHKDIEFFETFMFGIALKRNRELSNAKNTKFLKHLVVPGIINPTPEQPSEAAKVLRRALGLGD